MFSLFKSEIVFYFHRPKIGLLLLLFAAAGAGSPFVLVALYLLLLLVCPRGCSNGVTSSAYLSLNGHLRLWSLLALRKGEFLHLCLLVPLSLLLLLLLPGYSMLQLAFFNPILIRPNTQARTKNIPVLN